METKVGFVPPPKVDSHGGRTSILTCPHTVFSKPAIPSFSQLTLFSCILGNNSLPLPFIPGGGGGGGGGGGAGGTKPPPGGTGGRGTSFGAVIQSKVSQQNPKPNTPKH
jgi:hypothetical protein